MNRPEQALQISCISFMRKCVPPPPEGPVYFHPYNGGYRTPREASLGKAMGVLAGIPDLILFWRGKLIACELKAPKGVVSDAQAAVMEWLRAHGAEPVVIRDMGQFETLLLKYGVPLKGRIAA